MPSDLTPMPIPTANPSRRLRLLALGPQEPWPPTDGGKEGIHGALKALAARADVRFSCPGEPADAAALAHYAEIGVDYRPALFTPRDTPGLVLKSLLQLKPFKFHKYGDRLAQRHFEAAIGEYQPDAIVCFHAHMEEMGQRLKRARGWRVPVLVREHNIEYEMVSSYRAGMPWWGQLAGAPIEWLTVRAERQIWARADVTAFLTDRDHATALASGVKGRLVLAPEGVPIPPRRHARRPGLQPASLLMPLNRKAPQSVANLRMFLHDHWAQLAGRADLQNLEVVVTGANPAQLAEVTGVDEARQRALRVRATGFLPSLEPSFHAALVLVAPTFIGAGIRKKILEGMAHQVPVIATELDIQTCHYFQSGENILPLGTPEQFAQQLLALQRDEALWQRLSDAGRATVEAHASWERFADVVMAELQALCAPGQGRA